MNDDIARASASQEFFPPSEENPYTQWNMFQGWFYSAGNYIRTDREGRGTVMAIGLFALQATRIGAAAASVLSPLAVISPPPGDGLACAAMALWVGRKVAIQRRELMQSV